MQRAVAYFYSGAHITFVDDRIEHVTTCQTYGWSGVQFVSLDQLREELTNRGFLSKSDAFKAGGPTA
jgi:hypothetical protein